MKLDAEYSLATIGEIESSEAVYKWVNEQVKSVVWAFNYPKELSAWDSWVYVNNKEKYTCSSPGLNAENSAMINKYAVATRKNEGEKMDTEINEAFYQYDKGLIFIIQSEYSVFAVKFNETLEARIAEERSFKLLEILEDHLKNYRYVVKLH